MVTKQRIPVYKVEFALIRVWESPL